MNTKQEAKYNMYKATQSHCNANPTIVATQPEFANSVIDLGAVIAEIEKDETVVSKKTKGVAKDKSVLKIELASVAFRISSAIFAFAEKTKNNTLQKSVDYAESDLQRIKDGLMAATIQNIYDAANTNLAALAGYGVKAADLTELQTAMSKYSGAVPEPRKAVSKKAAKTINLTEQFKKGDAILKKQMDKLAVPFKKSNKTFYDEYQSVRKIITPASKAKKKEDKTPPKNDTPS